MKDGLMTTYMNFRSRNENEQEHGHSMKRWLISGLFLIASLIALAACGDSGSQPSTSTSSQTPTSTSSQTPTSTNSQTPTSTSLRTSTAKDVHIVMTEMKIESDVTTFTHG